MTIAHLEAAVTEAERALRAARHALASAQDSERQAAKAKEQQIAAERDRLELELQAALCAFVADASQAPRAVAAVNECKAFTADLPPRAGRGGNVPRNFAVNPTAWISFGRAVFAAIGADVKPDGFDPHRFSWAFTPAVDAALEAACRNPSTKTLAAAVWAARNWLGCHDVAHVGDVTRPLGLRPRVSPMHSLRREGDIDYDRFDQFVATRIRRGDLAQTYHQFTAAERAAS